MEEDNYDVTKDVNEQFRTAIDRDADEVTIDLDSSLSNDEFHHETLPYAIGYAGDDYGLMNVGFREKTLHFKKVQGADDDGPDALRDVAERMAEDNRSIESVILVQARGSATTYVDFQTTGFGVDWGETDDFGGWHPIAVEGHDSGRHRVWFHRDD